MQPGECPPPHQASPFGSPSALGAHGLRTACLRSISRKNCCRRFAARKISDPFPMARAGHSPARARLTPTATCCRRFAAPLEARAGARGSSVDSPFSWALSWLGGEQRSRGWSGLSEETSPTGLLCVQRWGRWNYWNSFCSKTSPACPLQDIPLTQQRPLLPHKPTPSLQRPPRG